MPEQLPVLSLVVVGIAVVHTLAGPDHYVPFVALSRARRWTLRRTLRITALCGLGHVASSVALATLTAVTFVQAERLMSIESLRGNLAAWGLIAFGTIYAVWGVRSALRKRKHSHWHAHSDGTVHDHTHGHQGAHLHAHGRAERASVTPWVLFAIFLFGPCEPLIPILMVPASNGDWSGFAAIASLFTIVTTATMVLVVSLAVHGFRRVHLPRVERWSAALAGSAVAACGLVIVFLGL